MAIRAVVLFPPVFIKAARFAPVQLYAETGVRVNQRLGIMVAMSREKEPYRPPHAAGDKFMEVMEFLARTVGGFRMGACCAKSALILVGIVALLIGLFF